MLIMILAYIGAYLVGTIPIGVIVGRAKGIDIMTAGSGNIGATNVARVLGKKLGILVFLLDVLKGAIPPLAFSLFLIPDVFGLSMPDHKVLGGVMAIIGHTLSPWIGFKGGKGIATGLGALLGTAPLVGLCGFGMFWVTLGLTRIVSISSVVGAISIALLGIFVFPQSRLFQVVYILVAVYVVFKHRANMSRLVRGEEPRLSFKKKSPEPAEADA